MTALAHAETSKRDERGFGMPGFGHPVPGSSLCTAGATYAAVIETSDLRANGWQQTPSREATS